MKVKGRKRRRNWVPFLAAMPMLLAAGAILLWWVWIRPNQAAGSNSVSVELQRLKEAGFPVTLDELAQSYAQRPDTPGLAEKLTHKRDQLMNAKDQATLNNVLRPRIDNLDNMIGVQVNTQEDAALAAYFQEAANDLTELRTLLGSGPVQFPQKFDDGLHMVFPHHATLYDLALVLRGHALHASLHQDSGAVLADLDDMFRLAEALRGAQHLDSQYTYLNLVQLAARTFNDVLYRTLFTSEELKRAKDLFASVDTAAAVRTGLASQAVFTGLQLSDPKPELRDYGYEPDLETQVGDHLENILTNAVRGAAKLTGKSNGYYANFLHYINEQIALAQKPWTDSWRGFNDCEAHLAQVPEAVYVLFRNSYDSFFIVRYAQDVAALCGMAEVACAAEQYALKHGHFPADLEALRTDGLPVTPADPFNGQPLRFSVIEQGYRVEGGASPDADSYPRWRDDKVFEVRRSGA